jgi:hypothetical protein
MVAQLLAFLGVSAVVICVPGPDTALTVRNALAGGRRCGVATAAGVAAGQAVWTLATSVGVAELIRASEPAFLVMKAVGAAYLVALGLQSLWTAAGLQSLWTAAGLRFLGWLRSPTGGPDAAGRGSSVPGTRQAGGPGADGWVPARPGPGGPWDPVRDRVGRGRPRHRVGRDPGPGDGWGQGGDFGRGWSATWPIRRWRRSF